MPTTPIATLIYDGLCARCTRFALWGQRWSQGRLAIVSYDEPGALELHGDLSYARAIEAPQIVVANGYLGEAAEAVAWVLGSRPGFGFIPVLYRVPILKQISQLLYWALHRQTKDCETCS